MNNDTEKPFLLPYKLIDIDTGDEHLVLSFKSFARHQDGYSIKHSGLNGDFEVAYQCIGTDSRFECDLTTGDLFVFYHSLDNAFDSLPGTNNTAILRNNNDTQEHTRMSFRFDRSGHCSVNGCFMNKDNCYKSGIVFDFVIDNIFVSDILVSLKDFFSELERIQGHRNFL